MRPNALIGVIILVSLLAFAGAGLALYQLTTMTADLKHMSTNLDSMSANLKQMSVQLELLHRVDSRLSETNSKLSTTNVLLTDTNGSLGRMLAESRSANSKLARMEGEMAVMSHKIAGSFLFRGVK